MQPAVIEQDSFIHLQFHEYANIFIHMFALDIPVLGPNMEN